MTGIEIATIAGTAVTLGDAALAASTLIGAMGAVQQGQAQEAAGQAQAQAAAHQANLRNAQAKAMEQQAGQERAVSQRAAAVQRRQGAQVSSRAQALAAASGGGALDPTIIDVLAGIKGETNTRALNALYAGEEKARGLEYGAVLERAGGRGDLYAGEVARRAGQDAAGRSNLSAVGGLTGGGAAIYDRFERRKARNTILESADGLSRYAEEDEFYN